MKKKVILISSFMVLSLFLSGCGAKLNNGNDAVVSFKEDSKISANDFYNLLKDKYGEDEIIDLIDETLLNKEYEKTTDEDVYVNQNLESVKEEAGENFIAYIKQYYNADSEENFKNILRLNYKRNTWIKDYVESTVTDKEIKTYYDKKVVGDMELSHIVITPKVASDATDSEKDKAEKAAKEEAQNIIKKLDKGASFKDLAKKYSEDEANKNNGGSLGYINREGYDENFIEGAIPLKKGTYTKTPVKSAYGYHIILKSNQKAKAKLDDDLKKEIKTTVANEKLSTDSSLALKSLEALREKYKMKINDSSLNRAYKKKMDELYKNQSNSTNENN